MMNMHDRYYEPEDDNDAEEFAERVDHEMKYANNPYTAENILEALADEALNPSIDTIATLLKQGDTAAAGLVLSSRLFTYWEDRTRREIENAY